MDELKVIEKRAAHLPAAPKQNIVEYAISKGASVEAIEKMWALQLEFERNEARKAYNKAMADFKADPPMIIKDKIVDFTSTKGRTTYQHATLSNVTNIIGAAMSPHGLSATFQTEQTDAGIKVTCTITHRDGHQESTSLVAGPDLTGNKNNIQAIGSTVSYLERYTLLALTGLATADMDDDGKSAVTEFIGEEQQTEINALLREANYKDDGAAFLKWLDCETVDTIPVQDFGRAKAALKDVIRKAGKK